MAILPLDNGIIAVSHVIMSVAALETIYNTHGIARVDRLNAGVSASVFASLAEQIDISTPALAQALGLSPRTLRNRTQRKPAARGGRSRSVAFLTPEETEKSFRAYRVYRRATEILGNPAAARSWMNEPQKALGEKAPLSLLARDVGSEAVLNLLSGIEYGVVQ